MGYKEPVDTDAIEDGTITNADIAVGANIAYGKVAPPIADADFNAQKIVDLAAGTNPTDGVNVAQITGLATDANLVHLAGVETITGTKTFAAAFKEGVQNFSGAVNNISATGGSLVVVSGGSPTDLNLPAAQLGLTFRILASGGAGANLAINANGGDAIVSPLSGTALSTISLPIRGEVTLVAAASGAWVIYQSSAPFYTSTTLPPNPWHGQEIVFRSDATTDTKWKLRYNANSGSSFKWEFVGGAPWHTEGTGGAHASTSLSGTYAGSSQFTALLAGEYYVVQGGTCQLGGASNTAVLVVAKNGVEIITINQSGAAGEFQGLKGDTRKITLAASDILDLRVRNGTANSITYFAASLDIVPFRVA